MRIRFTILDMGDPMKPSVVWQIVTDTDSLQSATPVRRGNRGRFMTLKTTVVPVIRPVPLSHIACRNWPYCLICRKVRFNSKHTCEKEGQ